MNARMGLRKEVWIGIYLLALLLGFPNSDAWAGPRLVVDGDPATIGWALAQQDGTTLTLTCEQVMWRGGSGKSFGIKEWTDRFSGIPRLLVVSARPLPVKRSWAVDITGTLQTMPAVGADGSRGTQRVIVVSPANVHVYCDSKGRPVPLLAVKRSAALWENKKSLAELAGTVTFTEDSDDPPLLLDDPPSTPPAAGSRDSIKWLPDGARVSINGAIVSAKFLHQDFFCVERSDRSFGIRVMGGYQAFEGSQLDIIGTMGTAGGERVVVANPDDITLVDYEDYPRPSEIGLTNRDLGGGGMPPFTLPVGKVGDADNSGPNNTGMWVRVWGTVTAVNQYDRIFYLDDGSGVAADDGHVGVKVYDTTYDVLPTQGSCEAVTGISAAEWPEGSNSSIRVVWKPYPLDHCAQSGSGTISGTITATGADGKTVRVYCAKASTTATFSGNTADYTLHVPRGDHAVTASVLGYKTTTQLATVSSGTPVDLDFTLPAVERCIDMIASPTRVPPDGTSQTTVSIIVRDDEGRRFGNEPVDWDVDLGTVISSDATTNAVGEAKLVLQAPSTPGTANVSVTVGSMTVTGYAEFASATAPSIRIVSPTLGSVVNNSVVLQATTDDLGGEHLGPVSISFVVDDQFLASALPNRPTTQWATYTLSNGNHTIRAAVLDGDREIGYSQAVTVNVQNAVYGLHPNGTMIYPGTPGQDTVTIEGDRADNVNGPWQVQIWKPGGTSPIRTISGIGSHISATWDGKDGSGTATTGQYRAEVHLTDTGQSVIGNIFDLLVQIITAAPKALVIEGYPFAYSASTCEYVRDILTQKGYCTFYFNHDNATWENFYYTMTYWQPQVFYTYSHGDYEIRHTDDCDPARIPQISGFMLKDAWVYSFRPEKPEGGYYEQYPAPGDTAWGNLDQDPYDGDLKAHYISELGFLTYGSPLTFVFLDVCMAGRIGGQYVGSLGDPLAPYGGQEGNDINDMASMFGIYDNMWYWGASYLSYFEYSYDSLEYVELTKKMFNCLKPAGRTLDWVIDKDLEPDYRFHQPVDPPGFVTYNNGPCQNWRENMPSYPCLRVFGWPWGTTLDPY